MPRIKGNAPFILLIRTDKTVLQYECDSIERADRLTLDIIARDKSLNRIRATAVVRA